MQSFAADTDYARKAMSLIQEDAQKVAQTSNLKMRDEVLAAVRICFPKDFYEKMSSETTTDEERAQLAKTVKWKESYFCYIEFRPYY